MNKQNETKLVEPRDNRTIVITLSGSDRSAGAGIKVDFDEGMSKDDLLYLAESGSGVLLAFLRIMDAINSDIVPGSMKVTEPKLVN